MTRFRLLATSSEHLAKPPTRGVLRKSVHFVAWLTLGQRHCGLFADGQFLRQLDQAV